MKKQFGYGLYPELLLFEAGASRKEAEKRASYVLFSSLRVWIGALVSVAIVAYVFFKFIGFFLAGPLIPKGFLLIAMIVVISLVGRPIFHPREKVRRELRKMLRKQGVMLCIPCGYDLTGRASDVCPECGQPHGLA